MTAVEALRARYDEITDLVQRWRVVPASDRAARPEAEALLFDEARLLDDARFDEWLALWAPDGVLWVPIDADADPADDQSFFLDDVRRFRERIAWSRQPSAWSQQPRLRTVRAVTNVEAVVTDDGALAVRSTLALYEQRGEARHVWAGHQLHLFTPVEADGARAIRTKVILVPELRAAVSHPGALL